MMTMTIMKHRGGTGTGTGTGGIKDHPSPPSSYDSWAGNFSSATSRTKKAKKWLTSTSTSSGVPTKADRRTTTATILIAVVTTFVLTSAVMGTILLALVADTTLSSSSSSSRHRSLFETSLFGSPRTTGTNRWMSTGDNYDHENRQYHHHQRQGSDDDDDNELGLKVLPYNRLYTIPDSMEYVGDRSNRYIQLRKLYDTTILPPDDARSQRALKQIQQPHRDGRHVDDDDGAMILANDKNSAVLQSVPMSVHHSDSISYDIYDCPETPPALYPFQWPMMDVLTNWQPDNVTLPASRMIYQGLCVFDYVNDYDKAVTYRNLEVPFVIVNDPQVARTVERWNSPQYMEQLLGSTPHRTEYSENNHFMYYIPPPSTTTRRLRRRGGNGHHRGRGVEAPEGWKQPTTSLRMPYTEWLRHATDNGTASSIRTSSSSDVNNGTTSASAMTGTHQQHGPDQPHWYFRLIGCGGMGNDGSCDKGSSEYLFDELPFFQPRESLYVVEPSEQKGIHCRFGMEGVIAENHFDHSRNAIVVLRGSRRYLLAHPNQCTNLALYPKGHPSARHSAVDWSNPNLTEYPQFAQATVNEVVLQAGQVLYLPTDWFHYIVSLELNFQCNTRSGITTDFKEDLAQCGF